MIRSVAAFSETVRSCVFEAYNEHLAPSSSIRLFERHMAVLQSARAAVCRLGRVIHKDLPSARADEARFLDDSNGHSQRSRSPPG